MKNERRKRRAKQREFVRRIERELLHPSDWSFHNANFDEALRNYQHRRCQGCHGTGWKERRHKPHGRVACRVCQGRRVISYWPGVSKIRAPGPAREYWNGRNWAKLWLP